MKFIKDLRGIMLLLLSYFSRVQLCVTPETAAHQASPSLGFSRQEHWSELPFPSPMPESEKWKGNRSVVSDSSRPHGMQLTRLLHPWDFPGKSTGVGCHCLLCHGYIGIAYFISWSTPLHSFKEYWIFTDRKLSYLWIYLIFLNFLLSCFRAGQDSPLF